MYFNDVEYNIIVSVIFIEYVEVQVYVSYIFTIWKKKKPTEMYYVNVY